MPSSVQAGTLAKQAQPGLDPNLLKNKLSWVAEAMCYWLQRLCGAGCGGYVVLVAEAMWCRLRRLCVGLTENKANSAFELCFSLCWG